jgi:hypothetical protein
VVCLDCGNTVSRGELDRRRRDPDPDTPATTSPAPRACLALVPA